MIFSLLTVMLQIPDPTLASRFAFAHLGGNLDSCTCTDYVNDSGFGNCERGSASFGNQAVCYVDLPSSCSDLTESRTNPGQKLSAEACKESKYGLNDL